MSQRELFKHYPHISAFSLATKDRNSADTAFNTKVFSVKNGRFLNEHMAILKCYSDDNTMTSRETEEKVHF